MPRHGLLPALMYLMQRHAGPFCPNRYIKGVMGALLIQMTPISLRFTSSRFESQSARLWRTQHSM